MNLRAMLIAGSLVGTGAVFGSDLISRGVVIAADQHAYFNALVQRSDFWKGYSFRPRAGEPVTSPYYERQFARPNAGGYQASNSAPLFVTHDTHMEAAKVVIPAWVQPSFTATLGAGLGSTDTRLIPSEFTSHYVVGRQLKIDSEVMQITAADAKTVVPRGVTVTRAMYGTAAAPHSAGARLYAGNNSLPNQWKAPLETTDGNTYVFTWDTYFTSSYVGTGLAGNKTFQFTSGGDVIWLEVKTRMDGGARDWIPAGFDPTKHVAGIDVRSYNYLGGDANWLLTDGTKLGPGYPNNTPLQPMAGTFIIYPDRWVRYWVKIEQRANDYDYFDLWVSDESQAPVKIYSRVPISVRGPDFTINKFWLEFNDSDSILGPGRTKDFRDLHAYVRNFAVLRNPGDITGLLQRPIPGVLPLPPDPNAPPEPGPLPVVRPAAPTRVRVIR